MFRADGIKLGKIKTPPTQAEEVFLLNGRTEIMRNRRENKTKQVETQTQQANLNLAKKAQDYVKIECKILSPQEFYIVPEKKGVSYSKQAFYTRINGQTEKRLAIKWKD